MTSTKKHIPRNFVSKNLRKTCIPSVIPHKKQERVAEAVDKEAEKDYSDHNEMTFINGYSIRWEESEDSMQSCLNDIGCSNLNVED